MFPNNPANEITNSCQLDCKAPSWKNIWVSRQMYNPGRNVDIPKRHSCPSSFGYQSIQTIVWNESEFLQGSWGRRWEWWSLGQAEGEEISQLRTICRNSLQETGVETMMSGAPPWPGPLIYAYVSGLLLQPNTQVRAWRRTWCVCRRGAGKLLDFFVPLPGLH